MEFLQFISQDFNHFIGFLLVVGVLESALVSIVQALRKGESK